MGHWEWEKGEVLLPSAEVARVRKAVVAICNERHALVREYAAALHGKCNGQRGGAYSVALQAAFNDMECGIGYGRDVKRLDALRDAEYLLRTRAGEGRYTSPTIADVEAVAPKYKAGAVLFQFDALGEFAVAFDGRTVTYSRDEGSVSRYGNPWDDAFWLTIKSVKWTRGTGGRTFGNDEYTADAGYDTPGAGGSHVMRAFGPLGEH